MSSVDLVPIYRVSSKDFLSRYPSTMRHLCADIVVETKPLLARRTIALIDISHCDLAIRSGLMHKSDRLIGRVSVDTLLFTDPATGDRLVYPLQGFYLEETDARSEFRIERNLDGSLVEEEYVVEAKLDRVTSTLRVSVKRGTLCYYGHELKLVGFTISAQRGRG